MDRNAHPGRVGAALCRSLSARRAWIEIVHVSALDGESAVALRKESVDRNFKTPVLVPYRPVALRKESVDRNSRF